MKRSVLARISLITLLLLIFKDCVTFKPKLLQPFEEELTQTKKIAFIQIKFSQRVLPILGVVNAQMYNSSVKKVESSFLELEVQAASEMTSFYVKKIAEMTGKEVLPVRNLSEVVEYEEFESNKSIDVIKLIAAENQAQLVIAVVTWVDTMNPVRPLGISGDISLSSKMYIFDDSGEMKGKASFLSQPIKAPPKDTKKYKDAIDTYLTLGPEMLSLLFIE